MTCNGCRLGQLCENPKQFGHGPKKPKIMIVCDSPTEAENRKRRFMIGKAGKILRNSLEMIGIDPENDVYYTSLVKCSCPEDRPPLPDEVKECQYILEAEIDIVQPELIIPTGNFSLKMLSGMSAITKARGRVVEYKERKTFPIIHPNTVLKQPKYMEFFTEDIATLSSVVSGYEVEGRSNLNRERLYCDTYESAIEELNRLLNLPPGSVIAFDLETTKSNPFKDKVTISEKSRELFPDSEINKISAIGFSDRPGYGCSIPIYHRETTMPGNQIGTIIKILRLLFSRKDIEWTTQNGKFEIKWMREHFGIDLTDMKWDTMLMHYLAVTEEKGTHGLDDFAWLYTDMGGYDKPLNDSKPKGELDTGNYDLVPWEILKVYLADDCDVTRRVVDVFKPLLEENEEFMWVWENLMIPATYTLADIEKNGMKVDLEWLEKIEKEYPKEIARIEDKIHQFPEVVMMEREWEQMWAERCAIASVPKSERTDEQQEKFTIYKKYDPSKGGATFNFGSTKQLGELLFGRMGLKTIITTDKGSPSTNDDSLKYMREQHPIVDSLMELRKVKHLYNNFVVPTRGFLDPNGLIHPTFNLHGTVTGRLSSNEPR